MQLVVSAEVQSSGHPRREWGVGWLDGFGGSLVIIGRSMGGFLGLEAELGRIFRLVWVVGFDFWRFFGW